MKIPEKIMKYPWRSAGIFVALALLSITTLAYVFGPDRVAGWIEWALGIGGE